MSLLLSEAIYQETLADQLVGALAQEHAGSLSTVSSCVVVQNAGLGRWLHLWNARKTGISAAVEMPFARGFISKQLEELGYIDSKNLLNESSIQWAVFSALRSEVYKNWDKDGALLDRYLSSTVSNREVRAWRLAERVAKLFDQYSLYRPEWLIAWHAGQLVGKELPHARWQAKLFQFVVNELTEQQLSERIFGLALYRFCHDKKEINISNRPVHVFGVSSFSPLFLKFFQRLSEYIDVHVYHLIGSEAFLGDLPNDYRKFLLAEKNESTGGGMLDWSHNSFLVACGQSMARFQSLLLSLEYPIGDILTGEKVAAQGNDLLHFQASIRKNESTCTVVGDGSISFHATHSVLREVQVLQQQLLAIFAQEPQLEPQDVLVMMPDISEYSHAIEAVFSSGVRISDENRTVYLPYCIGDQSSQIESDAARFFETLLGIVEGRHRFSELWQLFDFVPVREKLDVSESRFEDLRDLLQRAGIRWGMDGDRRHQQGHPHFDEFTWDYGIQRILSGEIWPSQDGSMSVMAQSDLSAAVGVVCDVLRVLNRLIQSTEQSLSFSGWTSRVLGVMESLFGASPLGQDWFALISSRLTSLEEKAGDASIEFSTFVEISAVSDQNSSGAGGLLRRGITFCRLQPVRNIPAKVICLLGMNEGAFPRQVSPVEFDLIHGQKKLAKDERPAELKITELQFLGDNRSRDEDRQLFLDCILNARERLYISFVGQDSKTNELIPPSVLVSQLIASLSLSFSGDVKSWITYHPLQEWSVRNFNQPQARKGELARAIHFNANLLPSSMQGDQDRWEPLEVKVDKGREDGHISLTQLLRFFKDPADYFVQNSLGAELDQFRFENHVLDDEVFDVDGLSGWQLRQRIADVSIKKMLRQEPAAWRLHEEEQFYHSLVADQLLPLGQKGKQLWKSEVKDVLDFLTQAISADTLEYRNCTMEVGSITMEDELLFTADGHQLIFINGSLEKSYLLEALLKVILGQRAALVVSLKDRQCYQVPYSRELEYDKWVSQLLVLYTKGQEKPLPFSIGIAYQFVDQLIADPEADESVLLDQAVKSKWISHQGFGDVSQAQQACFGEESVAAKNSQLRNEFMDAAKAVFFVPVKWRTLLLEKEL